MSSRLFVRRASFRALRNQVKQRRADLFKPLLESLEPRNLLATITLSTTLDEVDGNTSSIANLIATPGGTGISLREAIIAANNSSLDDIIIAPAGTYVLTIAGATNTTGDLDILNAGTLQIQGAGTGSTLIDGGGSGGTLADRIFEIQGATVTFEDLTIQNGYLTSNHGAGFYNSAGNVTLNDVQLDNNQARSTGAGDRYGGGFWSRAGSVTGTNVQLTNNQAMRTSGTNNGVGGGFWLNEDATVNFTNLVMTGNQSLEGGGFYISGGNFGGSQVTLTNATIENNVAVVRGGGFRNGAVDGVVTINGGTINQNIAQNEHGGGFYNNGKVVLNNVAVTANEVQGLDEGAVRDDSHGGGFFNNTIAADLPAGIVEIHGGSITGNVAYGHGGGFWNRGGVVTIAGTALDPVEISNNQAGADSAGGGRNGGAFFNSDEATTSLQFVELDNNKVSQNTGGLATGIGGAFYNTSNGRVLLSDTRFTNHVANEGGVFYQDGVQSRVVGTNVTMTNNTARTRGGAFRNATTEALVQLTSSKIENNLAQNEFGGGFYNNGDVVLTNTTVDDNQALDLDGGVITNLDGGTATSTGPVQRDGFGAGFYNSGGDVRLSGGSVDNNQAYGHGAGFYNLGGFVSASGTVINANQVLRDPDQLASGNYNRHGGGFRNEADGVVTLADVQLTNNSLGNDNAGNIRGAGGGFYNNGAFVTISGDTKITGNYAEDGGGFYSDTGGGKVTVAGSAANRIEINDNKARVRGGGFRTTASTVVELSYVDVISNEAEIQRGGGFYNDGGQVLGEYVRINANETGTAGRSGDEQGGAFWVDTSGLVSLKSSEISSNFAYANGGGFYNTSAEVELVDTKVLGNISYDNGGAYYADGDSITRATRTNLDANLAGFEKDGKTFSPVADRRGGAFYIAGNAATYLTDSTVNSNEAHEYGGGVNMENDTLLIAHGTTFSDNVAGNSGGAIRHVSNSRVELTNSTISGNYAGFNRASNSGTLVLDENDRVGGGIWVQDAGCVTILNHVTIADNRSTSGSGAGLYRSNGVVRLENSIVFDNLANAETATPVAGDTQNQIMLLGVNVVGAHAGSAFIGNLPGRITIDPNLSPLADNGGPLLPSGGAPRTHAIAAASSAANVALGSRLEIDQRGAVRPNGAGNDVGAYEIGVPNKIAITQFELPATVAAGRAVAVQGLALSSSGSPAVLAWEVLNSSGTVIATGSGTAFSFNAPAIADPLLVTDTLTVNLSASAAGATDFRTRTIELLNVDAAPTSATVGIAGSFMVNSAADDGSPGTLRWAISQANALATAGTVVIQISAGVNPTLTTAAVGDENGNANGDLDITRTTGPIHIVGQGSGATTINGGAIDRVFDVHSTRTLYLRGLTVTGGMTTTSDHGAGLRLLGGTAVLQNVAVDGNDSDRGTGGVGGGLYITNSGGNGSALFMSNGSISNNKADSHGGGFYVSGTTPSSSTVILENVDIAGNEASNEGTDRDGGAFYFTGNRNRLDFKSVDIVDNSTADDGGGFLLTGSDNVGRFVNVMLLRNVAAGPAAGAQDSDGGGFLVEGARHTLTFVASKIGGAVDANGLRVDGNLAESDAGGFHLRGRFDTVNLIDTIIAGNEALAGTGGGFFTQNDTERVSISGDSQIINNFAANNHGGGFRNDGLVTITGSSTNPIEITGNQARNGAGRVDAMYANNPLSQNDRVGGGLFNTTNGLVDLVDVLIDNNIAYTRGGGVFTNNGAITRISSSVPAIFRSKISNNHAVRIATNNDPQGDGGGLYVESASSRTELTDVIVTGNSASDEGAGFFIQSNLAVMTLTQVDLTNNTALDNGGGFYNASTSSEVYLDTVLIDGNISVTEHGGGFRNNGIVVGKSVTITNNEAGTDAAGDRIGGGFYSASGFTTLTDALIDKNTAFARGGGFFNNGGGLVTISSSNPGMFRSAVTNNEVLGSANDGGGFFQESAGSIVRLTDVDLNDNKAGDEGGGFYSQTDNAHVELTNVVIDGNYAEDSGAGFYNASAFSTVQLDNVEITNNVSNTENGGGFRNVGPITGQDVVISGNIAGLADQIANNDANRVGGGFWNSGSTAVVDLTRVRIIGNDAHGRGGGFYSDASGIVRLTDFVISGNTADQGTNESQGRGGGFWNSSNSDVTLIRGEVSDNQSFGHGGGFFQQDAGSSVTARNVTISGNLAGKDQQTGNFVNDRVGGGFWAVTSGGRVDLNHVTISNNRATRDSTDTGAGLRVDNGGFELTMANSIAYGNFRSADTATPVADDVENLIGNGFELVGNNIIGVATQNPLAGNTVGRSTANPNLGPLQDNGGFSRTHALNPATSMAAIDQSAGSTVVFGQRKFTRISPNDLGAFETSLAYDMTGDVTLILNTAGTILEVRDTATNELLTSAAVATTSSLIINGNGDDNRLTVDFTNGAPILPGGVEFNGGGQTLGDSLVLVNGTATTVTQTFTANGEGTIDIDGSVITYAGSEATDDGLTVANRIYSFAGGAETISLAGGGANVSVIDSTLSDAVRFSNPGTSLTVQTTVGTGSDVIQVGALEAPYEATLTINGNAASDQTEISGDLEVDSLTVTSALISLAGNVTTAAGGAITLTGLVRLTGDTSLDTSAGGGSDITVNGSIVAGVAGADLSFDAGTAGNISVTEGITSYYEAVGRVVVGEGELFTSRLNNGTDNFEIISVETAPVPGSNPFSNFRGLGYVQVLPDGGTGAQAPPNGPPSIDYRIRITQADTYRLFLRTVGFDGGSDSIYASIVERQDGPGGAADYYRILTGGNSNFATVPWETTGAVETTALSGAEVAMNWALTPGEYTLRIVNREDGVAVDAFVLQASSLSAPTGNGPAANGLTVGDVVVASANNITFGDAVVAASFTQNTGAGTTNFEDAAIVSGTFNVDRATVVAAAGLVADTVRVAFSAGATGNLSVTGGSVRIGNGDGNLDIGVRTAGSVATAGIVNLAGAFAVNIDVDQIRIGVNDSGNSSTTTGTLTLANSGTTTVNADTLTLGFISGGATGTTAGTLNLGGGTTTMNVDTFEVGADKAIGNVTIASGGTLNLTGNVNAATDLFIGDNNPAGSTSTAPTISTVNLTGGTLNATLDEVVIGRHTTGAGSGKGRLAIDAGTVTATSVLLASAGGTSPANTTGTIDQRGGTFTVSGSVTDGAGVSALNVDGGTLTIGAGMTVDAARVGISRTGTLNVTGGAVDIGNGSGTLEVGRSSTSGAGIGTLNLAAASSVSIDVANVLIGNVSSSGSGGTRGAVTLSTAGNNSLTATTMTIGSSDPPGNEAVLSTLTFGGGTNDVNVDTWYVARRKSRATVTIVAGGTLNLSGDANVGTDLLIGYNDSSGTGTTSTGVFDMSGGTFNATLDELRLGLHPSGTGAGKGTLIVDDGVVNATLVHLGQASTSGTSSNPQNTTGVLTVNGGQLSTDAMRLGFAGGVGTLNVNGGTVSVSGALDDGGGTANINLNDGTLQFETLTQNAGAVSFAFNSGTIQNVPGEDLVDTNVTINLLTAGTHTFDIDGGQLATIPAAATITGPGSLIKIGGGTLLLSGTNDFAGQTFVNEGVLQLQNGTAIDDAAGAVNVSLGGTLELLSSETISSYVGAGDAGAGVNDSRLILGSNTLTTGSAAIADVSSNGGSIVAATSILDNDDDNNISGTGIVLQAATTLGTAADLIETAVANLEASAVDGVFLASTTDLVIGGVSAANGVSTTNGPIEITSTGSLTVNENIAATGGSVTLITIDAAAAGQDLVIAAGALVSSSSEAVILNVGDAADIDGSLAGTTTVTIQVDAGNADTAGGSLILDGTVTAPGGAFFNGDTNNDTFAFAPQAGAAVTVNGNAPHGTPSGDVLILDLSTAVNPQLTIDGIGAGTWTFDAPLQSVQFISIESSGSTVPFHLVLDANNASFGNTGVDDLLVLSRSGSNFILERTGDATAPDDDDVGIVFQGDFASVLSFTYIGSSDNDRLTINDAGGLADFSNPVPGVADNPAISGTAEIFFAGGAGNDELVFQLTGDQVAQTYAMGDGTGTASDAGEVQSISGGVTQLVYFADVESVERTGISTNPGGLTVIGTNAVNAISIAASGSDTQVSDPSFTPFRFSGDNFSSVRIDALAGADTLELVSFGSGQTGPTSVTLNGGADPDMLRVHSTGSSTGSVELNGNSGSDLFQLYNAANTVDGILGTVSVDGGDGNLGGNTDTLVIIDSGDTTGDDMIVAPVDAATSADYAINGISNATGNDVVLRNIDELNYTGTSGNDTIDGQFSSTVPLHDLNSVTLSGWLGDDEFLLFTSDQLGGSGANHTPTGIASGVATIGLYGDAAGNPNGANDGADTFGETPPNLIGTGVMNVGLNVDDSIRLIRPSASTGINIDGGAPAASSSPTGDVAGDTHNLDISALSHGGPVIVSTLSPGSVIAGGIAPLNWTNIEDLNLIDNAVLTNVQTGDMLARATTGVDLVQLTRNPVPGVPNQIRVRLNTTVVSFSVTNKTVIYGGGDNDYVTQANLALPAEFYGEGGDDYLAGALHNDWLAGGLGNDKINGSGGDNVIWGDDAPTTNEPNPQDSASGGNDILSSLSGNDVFYGGGGDDTVSAGAGNDYAYGGQGNDQLGGSEGDDRLYGGSGNDLLGGGAGNDLLSGGDNDDQLYGNEGNDVLVGGAESDLLDGGNGYDVLVSGSIANENSSWTSTASTNTYSAATYTNPADNDAALLTLLTQWGSVGDRNSLAAITHDGADDDLFGGLGDDDFSWEFSDLLDDTSALSPADFNAANMGLDERFGPS